jgi:magnesium transporter
MDETGVKLPLEKEVELLLEQGELDQLRDLLARIHPADIAALLDEVSDEEAVTVFGLLSVEVASEVLDETGSLVRQRLVEKVDDETLADLLDELPMDDAAEFLEDLPDPVAGRLLELMEPEEAQEVRELLGYEQETAGRLMTRDVTALRRHWTVAETLDYLRSLEDAETLHYLYVVDREDQLIGVVPLRALIVTRPEATIDSIMKTDVVSVPVTADQEELAEMVARYDYYAMPVVDAGGRLLGVVTVDDVLDILEEETTEDIQRLGGSEPLEQPYFTASLWQVVRKRVVWLLLLFVASTLTSSVIHTYQGLLETVVVLGIFIPLIIGTGGNSGSQTVTTIIRAIAVGEVKLNDIQRAWRREVATGFIIGLLLGLIGFIQAMIWTGRLTIALVVGLTLPAVVMWANTSATLVPIIAERLGIDPTVVSAPMITTIVDATGLLIYFSIAQALVGSG